MLGQINSTFGIECEALAIADPGGKPLRRRELLPGAVRVVAPRAAARLEFRARTDPRGVEHPVLDLAGIGGRAEIDIEIALPVDRKRMHRMVAGDRQPGDDHLRRRGRGNRAGGQSVAHDAIVHLGIERTVIKRDAGAAVAAVREAVAKANVDVGVPITLGILKSDQKPARRGGVVAIVAAAPGIDVDDPIRSDDKMPGVANIVRENGCAKPGSYRYSTVVARAG